ncbi:MAG: hypothetical protein L6R39_005147 [Caloplaca ligustica]|nr:MAG: hypothetical protein L6R39_005147 [Caloplaca ligustica]
MPVRGNAPTSVPATKAQCDSMQLDDTKDKVYIHDLAAEIADLESDEETPLFLPDVEKKLSKIPLSVLTGKSPPVTSNQLVLYNVPSSISVPEEQDGVRRAIIESRARARERQAHEQRAAQEAVLGNGHPGTDIRHHVHNNAVANVEGMEVDDGAMEIE